MARGEEKAALEIALEPDREKTFVLPFHPQALRVFSGEQECCVYLKHL